jgi:acetyl esterase/lipase
MKRKIKSSTPQWTCPKCYLILGFLVSESKFLKILVKVSLNELMHLMYQFKPAAGELLPVMVFIYGGAFTMGDNKADQYGPHYLLDKDIVLVSINYRLGVLGE